MATLVYPDDARVWGVDISKWQDDNNTPRGFDFAMLKEQGASFIFIRAGQGSWMDPDFVTNWQGAKEADIPRGAYWFLDAREPGITQARKMRDVLAVDWGELPPVVDYEHKIQVTVATTKRGRVSTRWVYNTPEQLSSFVAELKSASPPILYTSYSYWIEHGSPDGRFASHPLWIAAYSQPDPRVPAPWRNWVFHQFTDKGNGKAMGAESHEIDLNYFNGTIPDFDLFMKRDVKSLPDVEHRAARNSVLDEAVGAIERLKG